MRAGPLSQQNTIDYLNEHFVNTSIILPQMKNVEEFFDEPTAREWAKVVYEEFDYPVDSLVLSTNGKPVSQISFSELYRSFTTGKKGRTYNEFLRKAIESSNE